MKTALHLYHNRQWITTERGNKPDDQEVQLALAFGSKELLKEPDIFEKLKKWFPNAAIVMCSTAGEIYNTDVYDDTLSVTAISFQHTTVKTHAIRIEGEEESFDAGQRLLDKFEKEGLSYLFVLSDGSKVNGSELVRAFNQSPYRDILITGGLAGDGSNFQSTLTGLNEPPSERMIIGIGFYGDKLQVHHGSRGGWDMFGLEKTVTRSHHNILYEMDDKNAVEIYKKYLGPEAEQLPGAALLFPLAVTLPESGEEVVRTILSINTEEGSMTFAGDIPEGAKVRFMKANFDKITNAASDAAQQSLLPGDKMPQLAILISCVGRKLILQSRTDEELDAVDEIFQHKTLLTGFYSYGEISPVVAGGNCQLHNQTMTITTFYEAE